MKCPTCKDSVLSITNRQEIEIDYCPNCRGVWLDRGELDKIIEKSLSMDNSKSLNSYNTQPNYPQQEGYYKYKKRKSLLQELFD